MNFSSLVNQQFSFALTLINVAIDGKTDAGGNRFTHYAFVQSVFLQWDLAVRYWFEEFTTSSAASAELKQLFESDQPIYELSLSQLLSRVEHYVSATDIYCDLSLGVLMDYRDDESSWLFVLEHALRSFCMSEREWHKKYHNKMNFSEKPSTRDDVSGELAQGVVLIVSTEATTNDADLQGKHWHTIELEFLHQLICDSKQFVDDGRNLNAEN